MKDVMTSADIVAHIGGPGPCALCGLDPPRGNAAMEIEGRWLRLCNDDWGGKSWCFTAYMRMMELVE